MGPGLGLFSEEKFKATRHKLEQMTELLFFTDGLIEQKQADGKDWGVEIWSKRSKGSKINL
tara:strand:+ start:2718 stop:2900 length:183 start_codon:yes stop_codon:yes gene_type:complete